MKRFIIAVVLIIFLGVVISFSFFGGELSGKGVIGVRLTYPVSPEPPPESPPLVFWYHRYEGVGVTPTFAPEVIAVSKGMIPIINISNSTFTWGSDYETWAMAFQAANGNCKIALVQEFWDQSGGVEDAWDTGGVWLNYVARRREDSDNLIMMIDVEPSSVALMALVNTRVGDTLGVAGTAEQIAAGQAFVVAATKYQFSLPDLRGPTSSVKTTTGSLYNILPGLGIRRINEYTYTPGGDYTAVSEDDVIGLRVSTDGRDYSYRPEMAKAAFPGWDKMYFNIETTESAKIEIVNKL